MINILSKDTIQKIAAGEVIERPSSIVKELVENSIDAEATKIVVEIENGGTNLISVSDNGLGIEKNEVEIAFKRHATSKLLDFNDLYNLDSLGFRGEALASILAVSKVTISTKSINSNIGTKILFENSIKINEKPVGMNKGTNIIVEDLFYNVPVRKKFLKSNIHEGNNITNLLYKLAIGNYQVGITYIKDEKIIFETRENSNLKDTIIDLYGIDIFNNLLELNINNKDFHISGYISNNRLYRANRSMQYLYVNGRYIENLDIRNVIEKAYGSIIPNGRFPIYNIFININPKYLDVNIHPNKEKVNIIILESILEFIYKYTKNTLNDSFLIPNINLSKNQYNVQNVLYNENNNIENLLNQYNLESDYHHDILNKQKKDENINIKYLNNINQNGDLDNKELLIYDIYNKDELILKEDSNQNNDNLSIQDTNGKKNIEIEEISFININSDSFKYIGNIFKTYLLFEDLKNEKLIIVDQHAAHERILFEEYMKRIKDKDYIIQTLVVPMTVELVDVELNLYLNNKIIFEDMGYDIELFGDCTLIIRGVPNILGTPENTDFFFELLNTMSDTKHDNNIDSIKEKIINKSCKNAIKSGILLRDLEVKSLLTRLMKCDFPYTCPHGRPILTEINKYELEKDFLRIK